MILNAKAAADPALREAVEHWRGQGYTLDVRVLWEGGQAEEFADEAVARRFDRVVVAGGDGTINDVVNGLRKRGETGVALGILPAGTANDFATSCGIPPGDATAALQLALVGDPTPIDVGRVNGRHFVNVASGGFGAEVTTATSPGMKDWFGGFAYFLTGVANMSSAESRPVTIRGPEFSWEGDLLGLAIGNGRQAGGGFQVTPSALVDDGLFDVVLIPQMGWTEAPGVLSELLSREPADGTGPLVRVRLPWLAVDATRGLQFNLDGEPLHGEQFHFEVVPKGLACVLPKDAALLGSARANP